MQGYKWSNETSSCLPALAIAIGIEKGSSPQSWWGPVILLWDGVTWKPQAFPLREQGKVEKDDDMGMKLTSVAFTNATTAFVAGSLNGRGYLVKWDGSAWSTVSHYPYGLDLGREARVASAPHISFAVTLSGPFPTWLDHATSDLKSWFTRAQFTDWSGHTFAPTTPWTPLQTSQLQCPGDVVALSGIDAGTGDFRVWAATTHQVLALLDDGSLDDNAYTPTWIEGAHIPESISALGVGCCKLGEENPMVWFAVPSSALTPGDKLCEPTSFGSNCMSVDNTSPPFTSGFALSHISGMPAVPGKMEGCATTLRTSLSTACAWAVGAGLPDNVGTIHGFYGNITVVNDPVRPGQDYTVQETRWRLYLDGRMTKPKLPPLRGSFILDRSRDRKSVV